MHHGRSLVPACSWSLFFLNFNTQHTQKTNGNSKKQTKKINQTLSSVAHVIHTHSARTHTQTSWRRLRGEIRLRQLEAPSALSFTTPLCVTSKYQPRLVSKCHRATGLCPDLIAWILIILYFCWYAYGKQQQNKKKLSLDFVFFFMNKVSHNPRQRINRAVCCAQPSRVRNVLQGNTI